VLFGTIELLLGILHFFLVNVICICHVSHRPASMYVMQDSYSSVTAVMISNKNCFSQVNCVQCRPPPRLTLQVAVICCPMGFPIVANFTTYTMPSPSQLKSCIPIKVYFTFSCPSSYPLQQFHEHSSITNQTYEAKI